MANWQIKFLEFSLVHQRIQQLYSPETLVTMCVSMTTGVGNNGGSRNLQKGFQVQEVFNNCDP